MIEHLDLLTPDPDRTLRTIDRCRRRLRPPQHVLMLERTAVVAVCAIYLAAAAIDVARILIR